MLSNLRNNYCSIDYIAKQYINYDIYYYLSIIYYKILRNELIYLICNELNHTLLSKCLGWHTCYDDIYRIELSCAITPNPEYRFDIYATNDKYRTLYYTIHEFNQLYNDREFIRRLTYKMNDDRFIY